ncbi:hypothetical protein MIMGU_mgv1a019235mg, partial [Erythranthe guttata]
MAVRSGVGQRLTWVDRSQEWVVYYFLPADICDTYVLCGAHGSCNVGNSISCLVWCVRRKPLDWPNDVFLGYSGIKMPDFRFTWFNESLNLEEFTLVKKCFFTMNFFYN